jgi:hypothetical protein
MENIKTHGCTVAEILKVLGETAAQKIPNVRRCPNQFLIFIFFMSISPKPASIG